MKLFDVTTVPLFSLQQKGSGEQRLWDQSVSSGPTTLSKEDPVTFSQPHHCDGASLVSLSELLKDVFLTAPGNHTLTSSSSMETSTGFTGAALQSSFGQQILLTVSEWCPSL
ncbi:hypothetical protein ATANTOWER_017086, partial [Ataeniobius toweri]|nr:hypothetical protein [Ataeniobius toweri]